jgi:hypothetical protein
MIAASRVPLPWQLRLARVGVGYAALISAFLALGLPWRISTGPDEYATALLLVTVVLVGLFSVVMLTWSRRAAWAATVGLGLLATHVTVLRGIQVLSGTLRPSANSGDIIFWLLGSSGLIALITALLCSLPVCDWRARLT